MRILVITGKLQPYRVPILNKVVERGFELTVAHSSTKLDDGTFLFKEVIVKEKKIGPLTVHPFNLRKFGRNFDIVIATFYLQKLSFMSFLLPPRKYKLAYWGIGLKASQTSRFDTPTFLNKLRYYVAKKSDAMIFYTDYARQKYIRQSINPDKLFVMNNTVYVNDALVEINHPKNSILFIGTLNKSKLIFELLEAYKNAFEKNKEVLNLEIIGKGEDFEGVKAWVKNNNLEDKIILHGAIYNNEEKAVIINRSICAISPNQAGLSVLEVMGYGLPFITYKDSYTGGERLNIKNQINGILFDSFEDLEGIILDIQKDKTKYIQMGLNAYEYYKNNRTANQMTDEFIEVVNYLKD